MLICQSNEYTSKCSNCSSKICKIMFKNLQTHNTFTLCVSTFINNVVIIVDGFGSNRNQYELS